MFGRLIGKALALPLRVANVPFAVVNKLTDGEFDDVNLLGAPADAIEESVAEALGDGEDEKP